MKCFLGLLVLYLLNAADSQSCCNGRSGSLSAPSAYPESNSPANGPSANSNAAVCYFYRSSGCLVCKKYRSWWFDQIQKCCTVSPTETSDSRNYGPTPYNEYLIGQRYTHPTHDIDWHNLYPKKEDNSGYYSYTQATQTGRSHMGLHPGAISEGCVTVSGSSCWANIESIVSDGLLSYRGYNYNGFLYVV